MRKLTSQIMVIVFALSLTSCQKDPLDPIEPTFEVPCDAKTDLIFTALGSIHNNKAIDVSWSTNYTTFTSNCDTVIKLSLYLKYPFLAKCDQPSLIESADIFNPISGLNMIKGSDTFYVERRLSKGSYMRFWTVGLGKQYPRVEAYCKID